MCWNISLSHFLTLTLEPAASFLLSEEQCIICKLCFSYLGLGLQLDDFRITFPFQSPLHYIPAGLCVLLRFAPDVALFGHICFGLGPVNLLTVWCHALFKGKAMRTGWKGARCGFTSKLLSWTTDDCHPWHSNLCHGQMTTFILTVDRYVILKRFIEEAGFCTKIRKVNFYLMAYEFYWSFLSFTVLYNNLPLLQRNNTGSYLKIRLRLCMV